MTHAPLPAVRRFGAHPVLADSVFARGVVMDSVLVAAGAALVAIAAQIAVPLYPVPITGQTLAVLLVGSSLGALRGALSMALYAVLGIVGLPIFSDATHGWGVVAGPSGGYIVGFIFAAALTGWVAQRSWDHRFVGALLSFVGGTLVTFAVGLPWLYFALRGFGPSVWQQAMGYPSVFAATIGTGLLPFIIGGALKAAIAAGLIPLAWRAHRRIRRDDVD